MSYTKVFSSWTCREKIETKTLFEEKKLLKIRAEGRVKPVVLSYHGTLYDEDGNVWEMAMGKDVEILKYAKPVLLISPPKAMTTFLSFGFDTSETETVRTPESFFHETTLMRVNAPQKDTRECTLSLHGKEICIEGQVISQFSHEGGKIEFLHASGMLMIYSKEKEKSFLALPIGISWYKEFSHIRL